MVGRIVLERRRGKERHGQSKTLFETGSDEGEIYSRGNLAEATRGKHTVAVKFSLDYAMKEVRKGYADGFVSKDEFPTALRSFQDIMSKKPGANRAKLRNHCI